MEFMPTTISERRCRHSFTSMIELKADQKRKQIRR